MKHPLALGILVLLTLSSCAPVASSVPKMATTSPRTGDTIVDNGGVDLGTDSSVEVITADQADTEVKALKAQGFSVRPAYDVRDREFGDLLGSHGIREIKLEANLRRVEIVSVFVLKSGAKAIPDSLLSDLDAEWSRNKKNEFSLDIQMDEKSAVAWAYVRNNLDSFVVASREVKAKK